LNPKQTLLTTWNNRDLFRLLWPLIVEQVLTITIGLADTVMVAHVGMDAVSGVSLVDQINLLLIIAFGALATGGTVVVSQFIGRRDEQNARLASRQLMYTSVAVSLAIMGPALLLRRPVLRLVYGRVAPEVMAAAETYFWISAISYPFLAVYNTAAALFRGAGNSRITMIISILVNLINIGGNALLIYVCRLGVAGAALATLVSRIVAALTLTSMLMTPGASVRFRTVSLRGLFKVSLAPPVIKSILRVGIPSGVESSMFQIGKVLVSRIFPAFGTTAIAANAAATALAAFSFMSAQACALAILTVVGRCIGAGDYGGAKRNNRKLMLVSYGTVLFLSLITVIFLDSVAGFFRLSPESHAMAKRFLLCHSIVAPLFWPASFTLPNALRAAGDTRYVMITASVSMWLVRVCGAYLMAYPLGFGPIGVWYAMFADWTLRTACYVFRWRGERWKEKRVI
jgi:putative MATE family efflux protein